MAAPQPAVGVPMAQPQPMGVAQPAPQQVVVVQQQAPKDGAQQGMLFLGIGWCLFIFTGLGPFIHLIGLCILCGKMSTDPGARGMAIANGVSAVVQIIIIIIVIVVVVNAISNAGVIINSAYAGAYTGGGSCYGKSIASCNRASSCTWMQLGDSGSCTPNFGF